MVRTEILRQTMWPMVEQLRRLRGSFEHKTESQVVQELLVTRDFLDQWALALQLSDLASSVEVITNLTKTLGIKEDMPTINRKESTAGIVESVIIKTCFEEGYVLSKVAPNDETIFLGPLTTGALMTMAVASTLRNIGVITNWVPVYVPINRDNFDGTIIPLEREQIKNTENLVIIDDGYSQPFGVKSSDPLRTAGAVLYKIHQLSN